MNGQYSEVREHLRQQHTMNTQEIHGKKVDNFNKYRYYGNNGLVNEKNSREASGFSFVGKICVFLMSVLLFSCYIYGGQDIEKGASMAWDEMSTQIRQLEEEKPAVKQAMGYVRKAYEKTKDFTETYLNLGDSE